MVTFVMLQSWPREAWYQLMEWQHLVYEKFLRKLQFHQQLFIAILKI
jgi:hypothetical protein